MRKPLPGAQKINIQKKKNKEFNNPNNNNNKIRNLMKWTKETTENILYRRYENGQYTCFKIFNIS